MHDFKKKLNLHPGILQFGDPGKELYFQSNKYCFDEVVSLGYQLSHGEGGSYWPESGSGSASPQWRRWHSGW